MGDDVHSGDGNTAQWEHKKGRVAGTDTVHVDIHILLTEDDIGTEGRFLVEQGGIGSSNHAHNRIHCTDDVDCSRGDILFLRFHHSLLLVFFFAFSGDGERKWTLCGFEAQQCLPCCSVF